MWYKMAEKENPPGSQDEEFPNPKKRRVSLKLDKKPPRFGYYPSEEVSKISEGYVPPNTAKKHSLGHEMFYGLGFGCQ